MAGVAGWDEDGVHVVGEPIGQLRHAGRDHGQARGEVLGELQRGVVEDLTGRREHERHVHGRQVIG